MKIRELQVNSLHQEFLHIYLLWHNISHKPLGFGLISLSRIMTLPFETLKFLINIVEFQKKFSKLFSFFSFFGKKKSLGEGWLLKTLYNVYVTTLWKSHKLRFYWLQFQYEKKLNILSPSKTGGFISHCIYSQIYISIYIYMPIPLNKYCQLARQIYVKNKQTFMFDTIRKLQ